MDSAQTSPVLKTHKTGALRQRPPVQDGPHKHYARVFLYKRGHRSSMSGSLSTRQTIQKHYVRVYLSKTDPTRALCQGLQAQDRHHKGIMLGLSVQDRPHKGIMLGLSVQDRPHKSIIIIIVNGNFYSATNYPCMGSLAALYNDIKT